MGGVAMIDQGASTRSTGNAISEEAAVHVDLVDGYWRSMMWYGMGYLDAIQIVSRRLDYEREAHSRIREHKDCDSLMEEPKAPCIFGLAILWMTHLRLQYVKITRDRAMRTWTGVVAVTSHEGNLALTFATTHTTHKTSARRAVEEYCTYSTVVACRSLAASGAQEICGHCTYVVVNYSGPRSTSALSPSEMSEMLPGPADLADWHHDVRCGWSIQQIRLHHGEALSKRPAERHNGAGQTVGRTLFTR
nr:hypothetical protein CFP56_20459 [Quercus suber]